MVLARGLSAQRRLQAMEPDRRGRRPPPAPARTRYRARARPCRGISHAADRRGSGGRWRLSFTERPVSMWHAHHALPEALRLKAPAASPLAVILLLAHHFETILLQRCVVVFLLGFFISLRWMR